MGDSLSIALLVHHQLEPGTGAPGSTLALAEALRTRGHRVDVIGLEIVGTGESLWTHLRFPLAAARRVRRALRQHTYDIIDASTGDLWLLTRREIATSPTAVLTRSHGLEPLGVLARRDGARRRELTLRARYRLYHGGWRLHEVRRTLTCSDAVLVLNERERQYVASLGVDRDDIAPSRRVYAGGGGSVRGFGLASDTRFPTMPDVPTAAELGYPAEGFTFLPQSTFIPKQAPHPPIILGGESDHTLRRVVEYCDGWFPRTRAGFDAPQVGVHKASTVLFPDVAAMRARDS